MVAGTRVALPPSKPLLIYDGECGFCRDWIRRLRRMIGEVVDVLPAQDVRVPAAFPEIEPEAFDVSVQLVETDGAVFSGAEAVLRAMAHAPGQRWPLRVYRAVPLLARCAERAYRLVADHRVFFSRLTRMF
jgi:predicted DCC family thiol-disulfide oxidoreductase YuxK